MGRRTEDLVCTVAFVVLVAGAIVGLGRYMGSQSVRVARTKEKVKALKLDAPNEAFYLSRLDRTSFADEAEQILKEAEQKSPKSPKVSQQ